MVDTEYDAIVFDNDGVLTELTETERLREAVERSFAHFDVTPEERLVTRAIEEDDLPFEAVAEVHGLDAERWWARREAAAVAIQREDIRSGRKGLYDDVAALWELDQALAIVSNNQHETIQCIVDHFGLGDRFETHYGREQTIAGAEQRKPDPQYIERALADLDTTNALYVGDNEKDVVAAHRGGIDSAFLRRDHCAGVALDVEPTYEFTDLRALVDAVGPNSSA